MILKLQKATYSITLESLALGNSETDGESDGDTTGMKLRVQHFQGGYRASILFPLTYLPVMKMIFLPLIAPLSQPKIRPELKAWMKTVTLCWCFSN